MPDSRPAPRQIPALTGFRFIAALMVLLGHGYPVVRFSDTNVLGDIFGPLAAVGMTLFFTLSGFVLWLNYAEDFHAAMRPGALRRFAAARFARLYPLFAVTLVWGVLVTPWVDLKAALPKALLFVPLLQAWVPANGTKVLVLSVWDLGHTWSISAEMFLYCCFPLLALGLWKIRTPRGILGLVAAALGLFAALLYLIHSWIGDIAPWVAPTLNEGDALMWMVYFSPWSHLVEFIAGAGAAALYTRFAPPRLGRGWRVGSWLALAFVASAPAVISLSTHAVLPLVAVLLLARVMPVAAIAFLLYYVAVAESPLRRILSWRVLVHGGEISYSLYMFHGFVLAWFVRPILPEFSAGGLCHWAAVLAAAMATLAAIASASYYLIEMPARRWLRARLA